MTNDELRTPEEIRDKLAECIAFRREIDKGPRGNIPKVARTADIASSSSGWCQALRWALKFKDV